MLNQLAEGVNVPALPVAEAVPLDARSGVLWKVRLRSDPTCGIGMGRPLSVPILDDFLRFISATLAYTIGPFCGEVGGVAAPLSNPDWNRELVINIEQRLASTPCCLWNSSSSSAAVIRLDVGRDLILAVLGWTGVPGPPCVGVLIAD